MQRSTHWFDLARHDEDASTDEQATESDQAEQSESSESDQGEASEQEEHASGEDSGKDWEAEAKKLAQQLAKWKSQSRRNEDRAKTNADKARKLDELEEANKSEAERLTARAEAAEKRATELRDRAVAAEVKAIASGTFADVTDAEGAINPADYVTDAGEIDTDGIKARLDELLEAKPHWRKAPAAPPRPKPDPGQGARQAPAETNFATADRADWEAELRKYGVRPRA